MTFKDETSEEYHATKTHKNSSLLKLIVQESPQVYKHAVDFPDHTKTSKAMELGTLIHFAVLEGPDFIKHYAVMPKYDLRKNDDKKDKEKWLKDNHDKVKCTQEQLDLVQGAYNAIFDHPDAAMMLRHKNCIFEKSGYYEDEKTGIKCKFRFDAYIPSAGVLIDVKSCTSAKPDDFARAIAERRYDFSMAMYGEGIKALTGKAPRKYYFIAVETKAPYSCAVYELGPESLIEAQTDYRKALDTLKDCESNNIYPGIQKELEVIELPHWFLAKRK